MLGQTYRALVVDDEVLIRQVTARALMREGFRCDMAADGVEAARLLAANQYDVVVTDLRMPNRHGHALLSDLLQRSQRPVTIVVTGVLEPRLAKDLYARGVDDIVWKPVKPEFLALKVKTLIERRQEQNSPGATSAAQPAATARTILAPVTPPELENRLTLLPTILPVSQVALEVFNMATADRYDAAELGRSAARDPALAAELLRLANGAYYNPVGDQIHDLERAVARIGQKRVGELALATNALSLLSRKRLAWIDLALVWKRSVAAGIAMELLVEQGGHADVEQGLLLGATMSELGRMILASLYGDVYRKLVAAAAESNRSLQQCEADVFPEDHARILARVLARWRIPADITRPLEHILETYPAVCRLPDPTRIKVELIKTAVVIARLAVEKWEPWDTVDFPPESVLKRLRLTNVWALVEQTKSDLKTLLVAPQRDGDADQCTAKAAALRSATPVELCYHCLGEGSFDFVRAILPAMGVRTTAYREGLEGRDSVLLNCLHAHPQKLGDWSGTKVAQRLVVISDEARADSLSVRGKVLTLPASFGALERAFFELAEPRPLAASPR